MLSTFCLRLAGGLIGSLILLFPLAVSPHFYRTHFLIALGLAAAAAVFWPVTDGRGGVCVMVLLALAATLLGSLLWSLEGAPGGRVVVVLTTLLLVAILGVLSFAAEPAPATGGGIPSSYASSYPAWLFADQVTSATLLGTATTAMLIGHSYLIAPTMSLAPLLRLLTALFAAIGLRLVVAAIGLGFWTAGHSLANLDDVIVLWLPLRWGLGFAGPLVLAWMARQTAKIRSTQSATGILYVVVIFCFLGELTSELILSTSGFVL